ncbi:MAG TPA: hypothetical protein VGO03_01190 [Acidimicrobiia bacterium]
MDEHQRRVWASLLDEIDAFHRGELTVRSLVSNLNGIVSAADLHDEQLLHEFWDHRNHLLLDVAPSWFDAALPTPGGEARFREWVVDVLARTDDQRS